MFTLNCRGRLLILDEPVVMGILNVTPDSFSDGGQFISPDFALNQALRMQAEGANIIDVGGESTRPGSEPVPIAIQCQRVIPVIKALRHALTLPISIDTTSSEVAKAALAAGADIINDVSGGKNDPALLRLAAETRAPIILMHSRETPKTMQQHPYYENVIEEVIAELQHCIKNALAAGIEASHLILDPGIGFAKRKQDNLALLAHLSDLVQLGHLVLLGTSRKRFMGSICDVTEASELVTATAVTTALGVMAGVHWFRVHDVKENRQAADVAWAIKNAETNT